MNNGKHSHLWAVVVSFVCLPDVRVCLCKITRHCAVMPLLQLGAAQYKQTGDMGALLNRVVHGAINSGKWLALQLA